MISDSNCRPFRCKAWQSGPIIPYISEPDGFRHARPGLVENREQRKRPLCVDNHIYEATFTVLKSYMLPISVHSR